MKTRFITALGLVASLAACSGGFSLNPLDWFSGMGKEPGLVVLDTPGGDLVTDNRLAVSQVTALKVERTTAGAIIHATGVTPRMGYWDAELVPENDGEPEGGVLTYVFRISEPRWHQGAGSTWARTVEVGAFLNNAELANVRTIKVIGADNGLSVRR